MEVSINTHKMEEGEYMRTKYFNHSFKSIKTAFILPLIVPLMIFFILISYILLTGSQKATDLVLNDYKNALFDQIHFQLDHKMDKAVQLNNIHRRSLESGILDIDDPDNRNKYFAALLTNYPQAAMTYIGLPDGSFYGARRLPDGRIQIAVNNASTSGSSMYYNINEVGEVTDFAQEFKDFDPRTRPWYKAVAESQEMAFSEVYSHFVFAEPTVTVSVAIRENGDIAGIFGVDYLITDIENELNKLSSSSLGQAFIVSKDNKLIASSEKDEIFKLEDDKAVLIDASESENAVIRDLFTNEYTLNNEGFSLLELDGKKSYVAGYRYSNHGLDWNIYLALSEKGFLAQINDNFVNTLFILILSGILLLIFIFHLSTWVTAPIIKLNESVKDFRKRNIEPEIDEGRRDEIGQLGLSIKEMATEINDNLMNLEIEIAERTAELEDINRELHGLSFADGLTGIANRRKFDDFFTQAFEHSKRSGHHLALMMMDIDNFKNYNDTYGHTEGDECLKLVARFLQTQVKRSTDIAARYGGEEFIAVVQDTDLEGVLKIAENIRKGVEVLKIEHSESEYKYVTISIGIIYAIPQLHETVEEFISKADQAMYKAKNSGRNKIVLY